MISTDKYVSNQIKNYLFTHTNKFIYTGYMVRECGRV